MSVRVFKSKPWAFSTSARVSGLRKTQTQARLKRTQAVRFTRELPTHAGGLVLKRMRQDIKYLPYTLGAVSVPIGGNQYKVTPPTQGVTYSQRIADEYQIQSIEGRFGIIAGDATNFCRIIMFQWFPDDNLDPPTLVGGVILSDMGVNPPLSPLTAIPQYRKKFKILLDKCVGLGTGGGPGQTVVPFFIPGSALRRTIINQGVAALGSNNIYYQVHTDSVAVPNPNFSMSMNTFFTD